jgi:phosphoribosylformylglycinamidine synthase
MDDLIYLPVAHGEGKFVNPDKQALDTLKKNKQIVFKYCTSNGLPGGYPDNPNGSEEDIAGITDKSGRILGLMPHPERHINYLQHPRHLKRGSEGDGMRIFRNGVGYAKRHL